MTKSPPIDLVRHLAAEIRWRRESLELSQVEAAERTACSEITWRSWERASRCPSLGQLDAIAKTLRCRVSDLLP